jgi:Co/Zn/Cd efflux system component
MQKSTFDVAKMDCPSEEQLVRMKLEGRDDVVSLAFDLKERRLEVVHAGDADAITRALESLDLGTKLRSSREWESVQDTTGADMQRRLLWQVLLINLAFFGLELIAGIVAQSIGLVADSLDMLADSVVYGLSLYAVGRSARHKGGVATISGVLQLLLAILGLFEAVRRFVTPHELPGFRTMIFVSLLALAGNAACLYLLQKSRSREAHMQASMIFTSNDVIANIGVIAAGVLVLVTASRLPDLIVGIVIFLLVGRGAVRILRLGRRDRIED